MKRTIAFLGLLGVAAMTGPALQHEVAMDADSGSVMQMVAPAAQVGWAVGRWSPPMGAISGAVTGFIASKVGWIIGMELGGPVGAMALGAAGAGLGGF